jgi:hypothetical protein
MPPVGFGDRRENDSIRKLKGSHQRRGLVRPEDNGKEREKINVTDSHIARSSVCDGLSGKQRQSGKGHVSMTRLTKRRMPTGERVDLFLHC